jgi:hypothetical protein
MLGFTARADRENGRVLEESTKRQQKGRRKLVRREEGQGRGYLVGGQLAVGGRCRLRLDLAAPALLVSLPT